MKKIKHSLVLMTFMVVILSFNCMVSQAQDNTAKHKGTGIPKFTIGRTITKTDIGFLDMVTDVKTRGAATNMVKVDNKEFKVGQKLSDADSVLISNKIAEFGNTHKPEKVKGSKTKTRGASSGCPYWNCYTCWWRDGYGNWYWYCCDCE
jgi:hypothetical protein